MIYKGKRVFIDSNVFIATYNLNDPLHKKAKKLSIKLKGSQLVTSVHVVSEVVTVLSMRIDKNTARRFIVDTSSINLINTDKDDFYDAVEEFDRAKTKNISFTDCTTIAICKNKGYKISALFTFDKHFNNKGIKLIS